MYKIIFAILFYLFAFSTVLIAQMTQEEYNSEKKLLTKKRTRLTEEIEFLKIEIDSLRNLIPDLEQILSIGNSELFKLKYGKEIGWRISNRRIWKGMTDEMVKDGWGKPDRKDKNVEPWGVFTQLYYGDIIFFFRDGKLTDWQEGPEK